MPTSRRSLCFVAALTALHCGAQPLTIYSSFGPGDTYSTGSGWLVNGSANPPQPYVGEAFAFTATGSGYLEHVNIAMGGLSAEPTNDLANIFLAVNSGGLPGARLAAYFNVHCPGPFWDDTIISLSSVYHPLLETGHTYWLCVEPALPTTGLVVNDNSLGLLSSQAQEFSPSGWIARGNKTTFAFSIQVTAVPEPSLTALAFLGLFLWHRRFGRQPPVR